MTIDWKFAWLGVVLAAAPVVAAPVSDRPQRAPAPDRLTPADADLVVSIDIGRILRTPVMKKHALAPLKSLLEHNAETRQFLSAAGLDPFKDISTISLSTSGNPAGPGKLLAVIRGHFDPAKAKTAADDYAKKHPTRIKSVQDGALPMWEIVADNKSLFAAFAGDSVLVLTGAKEETVAAVRRVGQAPQRLNKAMQTAVERISGSECAWMALVATEQIKQLLQSDDTAKDFAKALRSVTGTLQLTDDALLTFVVHSETAEAAQQIKSKLDDLLKVFAFVGTGRDGSGQIVKDVLEGIKLNTDKNDVSIRVQVSSAQLDKTHDKGK